MVGSDSSPTHLSLGFVNNLENQLSDKVLAIGSSSIGGPALTPKPLKTSRTRERLSLDSSFNAKPQAPACLGQCGTSNDEQGISNLEVRE